MSARPPFAGPVARLGKLVQGRERFDDVQGLHAHAHNCLDKVGDVKELPAA